MNKQYRSVGALLVWIGVLMGIGAVSGIVIKPDIRVWYASLNVSPLTPPNWVFSVVWTILYVLIAVVGWLIFNRLAVVHNRIISWLYCTQLILNWLWTPLFFVYHYTGLALINVLLMDICVWLIIYYSWHEKRLISVLMAPYCAWIMWATYLNWYVWYCN